MTDVLEALLRQEEAEEEGETASFAAVVLGTAGENEQNIRQQTAADAGTPQNAGGPETGPSPSRPAAGEKKIPLAVGETRRTVRRADGGTEGPRGSSWDGRSGQNAEEGAWSLYQTLRRLSFAAGTPKSTAATLLLPAEQGQGRTWSDLAGLDRRLEREARRYDGPFRLY